MIGIAMTTYNGEKYLKEQIDSILNQTVSDFELIVCDDVSSDSTTDILNGYAAKDSRVHVFRNEENLGFLKNFEKAIRICLDRGAEYVALSDQDDIWASDFLEVLLNIFHSNPDILLAYGSQISFTDTLPAQTFIKDSVSDSLTPLERLQTTLYRSGIFTGATMLIHKNFFQYALPIYNEFALHDIWFSALAEALKTVKGTSKIIRYWRIHNANASPRKTSRIKIYFSKRKIRHKYFLAKEILKRVPHEKLDPLILKELKTAVKYYSYNRFFLWRLFYLGFFIKRYKIFTYKINPQYAVFKYLLWG